VIDSVHVFLLLALAAIVGVIPANVFGGCCILHQILASFSGFKQNIPCNYNAVALEFRWWSISGRANIKSAMGLISTR